MRSRALFAAALVLFAALDASPAAAEEKASPQSASPGGAPHRLLEGIGLGKVGSFDEAWFAPDGGAVGSAVRVPDFRVEVPRPRADLDADLKWRDAAKVFADELVRQAGPSLAASGTKLDRREGRALVEGAVTRLVLPRRAASWEGWVGRPSGEGEIEIELLLKGENGKPRAALRHRFAVPPSGSVLEVVRQVMRRDVADFLAKAGAGN